MPVHRRSTRRSRSSLRRRTTWATFDNSISVATGGAAWATINLLANYEAAGGSTAGCTVVRTHLRLTQTSLATAADAFAIGLYRGQTSDVGASVVGSPQPLTDMYQDYAFWSIYTSQASNGAGPTWGEHSSNVLQLDLRAKRKIPELHMSWNFVLQGATFATSPGTFRLSGRVLLALP